MAKSSATGSRLSQKMEPLSRRDSLLDAAAAVVAAGDVAGVTMESVAAASGVSRALVYKHFANRHELLAALYERESRLLHEELTKAVTAAEGLEHKFRALIEGALAAQSSRGATFAALSDHGGRPHSQRALQRRRDNLTVRHFATLAVADLGLAEHDATIGVRLVLGAISVVLQQWRHRRTSEHAAELADAYVALAMGGLRTFAAVETRNPEDFKSYGQAE
jgi:AcrR family transcriptional regulator